MATILLKTTLELIAVSLLIFGFMHEREIIRIENYLLICLKKKIRSYKKAQKKVQPRRSRDLRLVPKTENTTSRQTDTLFVA